MCLLGNRSLHQLALRLAKQGDVPGCIRLLTATCSTLSTRLHALISKLDPKREIVDVESKENNDEGGVQIKAQDPDAPAPSVEAKTIHKASKQAAAYEASVLARHLLAMLRSITSLALPPPLPASSLPFSHSPSLRSSLSFKPHEKVSGVPSDQPLNINNRGPGSGAVFSRSPWILQSILCSTLHKAFGAIQGLPLSVPLYYSADKASPFSIPSSLIGGADGSFPLARMEAEVLHSLFDVLLNSIRLAEQEQSRGPNDASTFWPANDHSTSNGSSKKEEEGPRSLLRSLCVEMITTEAKKVSLSLQPSPTTPDANDPNSEADSPLVLESHRAILRSEVLEKAIRAYLSVYSGGGVGEAEGHGMEVFPGMVALVGSPHARVRGAVADYLASCVLIEGIRGGE